MSLKADILLDRIALKRQITLWRALALVSFVFLLIVSVEEYTGYTPIEGDYIARMSIEGVIEDDVKRDDMVRDIIENDRIKAVIVRIDSPGGTAFGGQQLYTDLLRIAKVKPVVSVMRTMATSAAYMTALGSDHIIAREGTITGSIGVIMQSMEITEMAKELGINPITVKSGQFKATPNPFEKYTDADDKVVRLAVDSFFQMFVDMVVERRKLTPEQVTAIADGRIYTGTQALEHKLIDELGGEEEALTWLHEKRNIDDWLEIKDIKPKRVTEGLFGEVSEMVNKNIFSKFTQRLDGLVSLWQGNGL